eukprot:Nitzschia sp. Nitz4//scaffold13_size275219//188837//189486//NITZ4_000893-RA/size275219-snap-gene-0.56-mRNA-1//-1//CDS//3329536071//6387//frame0
MAFHFPSFLAGTAVSGTAFLLNHQQLSYRNRLTYKWPLAEWAEDEFRVQWKGIKDRIASSKPSQAAVREVGSFSSYWNDGISKAKNFFDKQ